jgi:hypothetical protein
MNSSHHRRYHGHGWDCGSNGAGCCN